MEVKGRNHALCMGIGFLIMLPLGVLLARWTRTFFRHWFWSHATIQLLISAPLIFYGASQGISLASDLGLDDPDERDPHQKIGLALLAMYVAQLVLGLVAHFVKFPRLFWGGMLHRAPWNYLHVVLGLAILALAAYQVHYGMDIEWPLATGNAHPVPMSAENAWMALIIIFWVLYLVGMALLPRQFRTERTAKQERMRGTPVKGGEVSAQRDGVVESENGRQVV